MKGGTLENLDPASLKDIILQHEWMIMITIRGGTRTTARTWNKYQKENEEKKNNTKEEDQEEEEEEEQEEQEEEEQQQEKRRFGLSIFLTCLISIVFLKIVTMCQARLLVLL